MIGRIVFIAAFAFSASVWAAFDACLDQFPSGKVPAIQTEGLLARDLCFDGFAVLHSGKHKTPIYVVERLNRARMMDAKGEERTNKFYEEARLPEKERAHLSDYKRSGYSRGHLSPAADAANPNAMAQSFSLANMVPQDQAHNSKTWAKIEADTRKYAMRAQGDVFVFTGPWYDGQARTIGNGVRVPDVIWKLVYNQTTGKAWVHWSRNAADESVTAPISYEEFVRRTKLELLQKQVLLTKT